jgi:hypothetical protein
MAVLMVRTRCRSTQVVYVPELNDVFWTAPVVGVAWTLNLGFMICIFSYTETIKYFARHDQEGFIATHVAW